MTLRLDNTSNMSYTKALETEVSCTLALTTNEITPAKVIKMSQTSESPGTLYLLDVARSNYSSYTSVEIAVMDVEILMGGWVKLGTCNLHKALGNFE